MGAWAEANLHTLSEAGLREYERLLNRETIDLYNWSTGRVPIPPELEGGEGIAAALVDFCSKSPLGRADPKRYAEVKKTMSN
jgi:succinate dehydrogenase assembly factor 2